MQESFVAKMTSRKQKLETPVAMNVCAPISQVLEALSSYFFQFHDVDIGEDYTTLLQYCVWLLEATILPDDSNPKHWAS